jgi:hypothetical protein
MAKVYGMHMIGLRPGVKGEDFEKFFREKVAPLPGFPGTKWHLLKGERGDRVGKYLVLVEIESVEARNRFAPAPDGSSDEAQRFMETHKAAIAPVLAEWEKLASGVGAPTIYTDYVVVGESA